MGLGASAPFLYIMSTIPTYFYYEGKLHRKKKVIRSDQTLVAWCYRDQHNAWLPLSLVRRTFQRAYTISQAAKLIGISQGRVRELIRSGLVKPPEKSYDYLNGTYDPLKDYFSQDEMMELRQAAWDALRKNRFGEPYDDTMISAIELEHRMNLGDDREFITDDNGAIIKIYQA